MGLSEGGRSTAERRRTRSDHCSSSSDAEAELDESYSSSEDDEEEEAVMMIGYGLLQIVLHTRCVLIFLTNFKQMKECYTTGPI